MGLQGRQGKTKGMMKLEYILGGIGGRRSKGNVGDLIWKLVLVFNG